MEKYDSGASAESEKEETKKKNTPEGGVGKFPLATQKKPTPRAGGRAESFLKTNSQK